MINFFLNFLNKMIKSYIKLKTSISYSSDSQPGGAPPSGEVWQDFRRGHETAKKDNKIKIM